MIGHDDMIEGDDVTYLYPDLMTGLQVSMIIVSGRNILISHFQGVFKAEKLVSGRRVKIIKVSNVKGNLLLPEFSSVKGFESQIFSFKESTFNNIAEHPLRSDVYESQYVSCKKSRFALILLKIALKIFYRLRVGVGEGLYLKRHIKKDIVVAFYNGVSININRQS